MNLIIKVSLFIVLIFSTQYSTAKIYYAESANKIKKSVFSFTLKKMDSSDEFNVLKAQKVGIGHEMSQYFSPSGKYLVVYLTRKKKETDELIVYSTEDFTEIFRKKIKIPYFYFGVHIKPFFNADETVVALQAMKSKKVQMVNAYNVENGNLLYSKPLEKKAMLIGQSSTQNTLYIGGKPGLRGYSSIEVIDMKNGETLNKLAKKRAKYQYLINIQSNLFLADYFISESHSYEIIVLNKDSGKPDLRERTGKISPVFTTMNEGKNVYFVKKSRKDKGMDISQLVNNTIIKLAHSEVDIKPVFLTVSNHLNRFVVASNRNFVLMDIDNSIQSKKIGAPFDIATGYFSSDDSLIYMREGTGSEVAVVDFNQQRVIKDSGTGRQSVKFGQFMATVALGAATGYYTGYVSVSYIYSDTAMLLSRNEQRLYVVNAKTNDVTLFDAKDLSGRKGIATGKGTFGVFQLKSKYYPDEKDANVFVLSPRSISYFNHSSLDVVKKIEFKIFINFDVEENLLFTIDKLDNLNIHELSTGEKISSIEHAENLKKMYYYSSER